MILRSRHPGTARPKYPVAVHRPQLNYASLFRRRRLDSRLTHRVSRISALFKRKVVAPIRQVPDSAAVLVLLVVWALSVGGVELALRAGADGATAVMLIVAVTFLLVSSWHLLWVALAWVSTRPKLPKGIQHDLSGFVTRWGTSAAKKTVRVTGVGAAATASLALTIPASFAFDAGENPDLLWSDTTTENTLLTSSVMDLGWGNPLAEGAPQTATITTENDTQPEPAVPEVVSPVGEPPHLATPPAEAGSSLAAGNGAVQSATDGPAVADPQAGNVRSPEMTTADLSVSAAGPSSAAISTIGSGTEPSMLGALFSRFMVPQLGKPGAGRSQDSPGSPVPPFFAAQATPPTVEAQEPSHYEVQEGDNLWSIAADHLEHSGAATNENEISSLWKQIYSENEAVIGADPNLIFVGMKLAVPTS